MAIKILRWPLVVIMFLLGIFSLIIYNFGSAFFFFLTAFYASPLRGWLWDKCQLAPMSKTRKLLFLLVLLFASFLSLGAGGRFETEEEENSSEPAACVSEMTTIGDADGTDE